MENSRIFYINSANRINGIPSNFSYKIFLDQEYTHAVVLQMSIPISYYLVDEPLNYFTLVEGTSVQVITISPGNYNALSFVSVLQSILNRIALYTYTISLPNQSTTTSTGKYTFTVSGNGNNLPSFIFDNETLLYKQFGFNPSSTNTFNTLNTLVSANVVNFVNESTLFVYSDMITNYNDNILQEMYTNAQPLGIATYQLSCNPEFYSKPLLSNSSNVYNFSVTDSVGNILDLNGENILITVLLYKKDETLKNILNLTALQH